MKAHTILQAAINSARTPETKNRLEEISWSPGYAEPGYSITCPNHEAGVVCDCGKCKLLRKGEKLPGIYFGNWNEPETYKVFDVQVKVSDSKILPRLARALEKAGAEVEWNDEWRLCEECSLAFRCEPDNFWWKPSGVVDVDKGTCYCLECAKEKSDTGSRIE